ncbi:MAG: hypothetical protein ABR898_15575 [Terracidiphilus sp.]|jgi:hypothetical protein
MPLKQRLWYLSIIVAIATWQAYAAFDRFFWLTTEETANQSNEVWFLIGPISLFLASALGLLFALCAVATKHRTGKKFWSVLLWLPTAWLAAGALVFLYLDWFGQGLHSSPLEHIRYFFIIAVPMLLAATILGSAAHVARSAPGALISESSVKWKRLLGAGARAVAWLSLAVGSVLAVLASALLLLMASCTPPSLESLTRSFPSERPDLETIIRMSDQDPGLSVIDPRWLQLRNGTQFSAFDPRSGITEARWDEYRRIFRRDDITQGIRRYQANGDAFIIVKSEGLLDNGYSNGFVYCGPGPEHSYPPCSSKQDRGNHPYTQGDEAYSFIRLSDHWFAFSQGPG